MVRRRASSGSPSTGTPTGGVPIQRAWPSCAVRVASLRTPMKEYRDQDRPFSADSRRKVPVRSAASFR